MANFVKHYYNVEKCPREEYYPERTFGPDFAEFDDKPPAKTCIFVKAEDEVFDKHSAQLAKYQKIAWDNSGNAEIREEAERNLIDYAESNGMECVKHVWQGGLSFYAGNAFRMFTVARSAIEENNLAKLQIVDIPNVSTVSLYLYRDCLLHYAIERNASFNIIKYLLSTDGIDIKMRDNNGESVLDIALSQKANYERFKFLIDLGADVNDEDRNGYNILRKMISESMDLPELATLFINAGVDLTKKDKDGYTVLDDAKDYECPKCEEVIREAMKG